MMKTTQRKNNIPKGRPEDGRNNGELDRAINLAAASHILAGFSLMLIDASHDIIDAYQCKSSALSRCRQLTNRSVDAIRLAYGSFKDFCMSDEPQEAVDRSFRLDNEQLFIPVCRTIGIEALVRDEWHRPDPGNLLSPKELGDKKKLTTDTHQRVLAELDKMAAHEHLPRYKMIEQILVSYINRYHRDVMQ